MRIERHDPVQQHPRGHRVGAQHGALQDVDVTLDHREVATGDHPLIAPSPARGQRQDQIAHLEIRHVISHLDHHRDALMAGCVRQRRLRAIQSIELQQVGRIDRHRQHPDANLPPIQGPARLDLDIHTLGQRQPPVAVGDTNAARIRDAPKLYQVKVQGRLLHGARRTKHLFGVSIDHGSTR